MLGNAKASLKLFALFLWIGILYPPTWVIFKLGKFSYRDRISQLCNRGILRIVGIRLTITGALAQDRPLLLVTNHLSYLDIPILASNFPVCFTPKSEIAGWPIIGGISKLSGAIFIDRRPEKMVEVKKSLQDALAQNRVVSLFPEATTGNGLHLERFKSGFFSLADEAIGERQLIVQPACITYTHIRGLPMDSSQWPLVAWYGDMDLAPHAWELLKLSPISAHLSFLPPVSAEQIGDRKKIASHCQRVIAEEIQTLRGQNVEKRTKILRFSPKMRKIKSSQ